MELTKKEIENSLRLAHQIVAQIAPFTFIEIIHGTAMALCGMLCGIADNHDIDTAEDIKRYWTMAIGDYQRIREGTDDDRH